MTINKFGEEFPDDPSEIKELLQALKIEYMDMVQARVPFGETEALRIKMIQLAEHLGRITKSAVDNS
jgi:hypothetical protein